MTTAATNTTTVVVACNTCYIRGDSATSLLHRSCNLAAHLTLCCARVVRMLASENKELKARLAEIEHALGIIPPQAVRAQEVSKAEHERV